MYGFTVDITSLDEFAKLKLGQDYQGNVTQPRKLGFLKKYMKLITMAWIHSDYEHKMPKDRFRKNERSLDAKYKKLPAVFKKRLKIFRDSNPNFRWEYEAYEMTCCVDAVKIAKAVKTVKGLDIQLH